MKWKIKFKGWFLVCSKIFLHTKHISVEQYEEIPKHLKIYTGACIHTYQINFQQKKNKTQTSSKIIHCKY